MGRKIHCNRGGKRGRLRQVWYHSNVSWVDEICVSCGVCCTTLSIVHITQADLDGLMLGYNLSAEQAEAMVRRDGSQFRILMDNHAACRALSSHGGRYTCQAYRHRPGICREYECFILANAKDWMSKRGTNENVADSNPFHTAEDEEELRRQVESSIQRMRSDNRADCVQLQNGAKGRVYDHLPELIETLSGAEFDSRFPPG
jgi:Fe-S-cluster containining protein